MKGKCELEHCTCAEISAPSPRCVHFVTPREELLLAQVAAQVAALKAQLAECKAARADQVRCVQNAATGYQGALRWARRWKAKAKELRKLRVAAERWEAFHDDCTCGAATVHPPDGVLRGGELRRLAAAYIEAFDDYAAGECWNDKPDLALAALRRFLESTPGDADKAEPRAHLEAHGQRAVPPEMVDLCIVLRKLGEVK